MSRAGVTEIRRDAGPRPEAREEPGPEVRESAAAPSEKPARRRGRRALRAGIVLVLLAALAGLGGKWLMARWSQVTIDDARIAADLVAVSGEVAGRVLSVPVVAGERVDEGDVLVSIDREQAELVVAESEARIAALDARIEQLRAQQEMIRSQIDSRLTAARAQIAAAEADHAARAAELQNAESHHDRVKELADRKVATSQDLDNARTALATARQQELAGVAAVETARANVAMVEADAGQIAVIDRQIATLAAERAGLEAERAQKLIDLRHREVTAAFPGIVDATFVDEGEYVAPGARLLIYHRPDEVWVDANVKETDYRNIRLGAPATIEVDAYPGRVFQGEVQRIGRAATSEFALLPSPNPSGNFTKVTQRLPIRVAIDTGDAVLSPGMMVVLSVDVSD